MKIYELHNKVFLPNYQEYLVFKFSPKGQNQLVLFQNDLIYQETLRCQVLYLYELFLYYAYDLQLIKLLQ